MSGLYNIQRNWKTLEDKFPDRNVALVSTVKNQPQLHLNQLEWQMWEFTKGTESIIAIAEQLRLPIVFEYFC